MPDVEGEGEILERIRKARAERDRTHETQTAELRRLCHEARDAGATWPEIATAMGMTRQGLHNFLR